jgi:hypothetical protein
MTKNLLTEAIIVGISLVIIGMAIHLLINKIHPHDMNNNGVLVIHFFIIGIVVHLLSEYFGINKWYCLHGVACSK